MPRMRCGRATFHFGRSSASGSPAKASIQASALVADSYDIAPLGVNVGIVVSPDGRVMSYRHDGHFTEWSDITGTWRERGGSEEQYIVAAIHSLEVEGRSLS